MNPFSPYVYGGIAIAFLLVLSAAGLLYHQRNSAREDRDIYKLRASQYKSIVEDCATKGVNMAKTIDLQNKTISLLQGAQDRKEKAYREAQTTNAPVLKSYASRSKALDNISVNPNAEAECKALQELIDSQRADLSKDDFK